MAGSVNKVTLVGNLGKDPEVRNTQSGSKVVSFPLATSDTWNDRQSGERRERTEWHRVVIFNERVGDVAERFLRKGRKVSCVFFGFLKRLGDPSTVPTLRNRPV